MDNNYKIADIMNDKIITLHPKDKIRKARGIFDLHAIHHIPIVVMDRVVGILSYGDILYYDKNKKKNCDKFPLSDSMYAGSLESIMTADPFCIQEDADLVDAIELMQDKRINCLPVLKGSKLTGLITTYDILNLVKNKMQTL